MKKIVFAFTVVMAIGFFSAVSSDVNKGAPDLEVFAGKKGSVAFPHAKHQAALEDCSVCHNLFPQKTGSIDDLIKQGKLEKKQAMKQCRGCHREMKNAGKKTGPISCSKCHS